MDPSGSHQSPRSSFRTLSTNDAHTTTSISSAPESWSTHGEKTWFVCFFLWCTRVLSPRCLYLVNNINVCIYIYIYLYLPVCIIYMCISIYICLNNTTKHLCYESQANRAQLALLLPFGSPLQGPWPWPATNSAGEQCHLIATSKDMLATSKCIGTKKGN